jgi:hypothetical protein
VVDRAGIERSPFLIWGQASTRRIPLTPALVTELRLYRALSGVGPYRLLTLASSPAPAGLDHHNIYSWMRRGCKSARADHFAYVLDFWRGRAWGGPGHAAPDRIAITAALRARLRAHVRRIGLGAITALSATEPLPEGLSAAMIESWLSGTTRTALRPHLKFVLDRWAAMPAQRNAPERPRRDEWVPVTDALRRELKHLRARSGLTARKLLARAGDVPSGLTATAIEHWMRGSRATASGRHVRFVLSKWRRRAAPFVALTDALRREMLAERARTGLSPSLVLKRFGPAPDGLTPCLVKTWLSGHRRWAHRDHLAFLLESWRAAPDRLTVTPHLRSRLQAEAERIGREAVALLSASGPLPEGLSKGMVQAWLSGATRSALRPHLEFVLDRWAAMPGREAETGASGRPGPVPAPKAAPMERVEVTAAIREELQRHRERTGLGPGAFLSFVDKRPPGLGHAAVAGWLSGVTKTARADHLAFVRRAWAEIPPRIEITEDKREALIAERTRTGIAPQALLRTMAKSPRHLNAGIIASWLSGAAATAFEHHLDGVLEAWRALPDAPEHE